MFNRLADKTGGVLSPGAVLPQVTIVETLRHIERGIVRYRAALAGILNGVDGT